jgi:hypothetical protein
MIACDSRSMWDRLAELDRHVGAHVAPTRPGHLTPHRRALLSMIASSSCVAIAMGGFASGILPRAWSIALLAISFAALTVGFFNLYRQALGPDRS